MLRRADMSFDADLCDRIRQIFWHKLNLEVPSIDADLIGTLDSLHLVDLLLHLEQEFQTSVSPEDLEIDNFRTIEGIASFITNKKAFAGNGSASPDPTDPVPNATSRDQLRSDRPTGR